MSGVILAEDSVASGIFCFAVCFWQSVCFAEMGRRKEDFT